MVNLVRSTWHHLLEDGIEGMLRGVLVVQEVDSCKDEIMFLFLQRVLSDLGVDLAQLHQHGDLQDIASAT